MITGSNTFVWSRPWSHSSKSMQSLRGRRLEGKGKGVLCARETLSMQRVPYVQIPNYPFAHRPGYLPLNILHNFCFSFLLGIAAVPREIACVASVSVWFRSKERLRNGILGFGRARNETSAKKRKWGEREGVSFLSSHPLSALLLALYFAPSLTLVPRSLLLKRTERLLRRLNRLSQRRGGGRERGGLILLGWRSAKSSLHLWY